MSADDGLQSEAGSDEAQLVRFTPEEVEEIREALAESDAEFARGEGLSVDEVRRQLGIT